MWCDVKQEVGQWIVKRVEFAYVIRLFHPFFPSHVLFRPRSRGALHPVSVRPKTPGGDDHPVQLQPRLHPAGRRHHHLLRSRAGDPRVDVSTPPLCLWVSDRRVFTVSRGRKEHKTPAFSFLIFFFSPASEKLWVVSSIKLLGVLMGSCGLLVIRQPPLLISETCRHYRQLRMAVKLKMRGSFPVAVRSNMSGFVWYFLLKIKKNNQIKKKNQAWLSLSSADMDHSVVSACQRRRFISCIFILRLTMCVCVHVCVFGDINVCEVFDM